MNTNEHELNISIKTQHEPGAEGAKHDSPGQRPGRINTTKCISPERAKQHCRNPWSDSINDTMWRLMNVMFGIDYVTPFQGLNNYGDIVPRALPWAVMSLRFQRDSFCGR